MFTIPLPENVNVPSDKLIPNKSMIFTLGFPNVPLTMIFEPVIFKYLI